MKSIFQVGLWWLYQRLFRVRHINGLKLIDIRLADEGAEPLARLLSEAAAHLQTAGHEYKDLVAEEIHFIAATRDRRASTSLRLRAYMSPFSGYEGENSFYLACRLVWIGSYFRLHGEAVERGERLSAESLRVQSYEQQLQFADCFPDADRWKEYLKGVQVVEYENKQFKPES